MPRSRVAVVVVRRWEVEKPVRDKHSEGRMGKKKSPREQSASQVSTINGATKQIVRAARGGDITSFAANR